MASLQSIVGEFNDIPLSELVSGVGREFWGVGTIYYVREHNLECEDAHIF